MGQGARTGSLAASARLWRRPIAQYRLNLGDGIRRPAPVDYGMTVGTHGSQIPDRIDLIFSADLCERHQVVNADEVPTRVAIARREVEPASYAAQPVVLYAAAPYGVGYFVAQWLARG